MQKNMLLIVNPKAGKGTIKRKLPKIIKNFSDEGYFIETCYTKKDYKPKDILKELRLSLYYFKQSNHTECCKTQTKEQYHIRITYKFKTKK